MKLRFLFALRQGAITHTLKNNYYNYGKEENGKEKIGCVVVRNVRILYYDDITDEYICDISLDEDEMADFIYGQTRSCPYYRYYDEYKSVQKQN